MTTDDKNKSARQAALDAKLDEVRACFRDAMVRYALEGVEIAMVIRLSDPQARQKTLALDVVNAAHCDDCAAMIFEAAARVTRKHAGAPPEIVEVDMPATGAIEPPVAGAPVEEPVVDDGLPKMPTGETIQ